MAYMDTGTARVGVAGDDVPDDESSTVTLEVMEGQSRDEAIEHPGDEDWFKVTLSSTNTYQFTLTPENPNNPGGPDLKLTIYDASGAPLQEIDGGSFGEEEELDFTPVTSGTYFVAVSSFTAADVGTYTIRGQIDDDGPNVNFGTPLASIDWGGTENRVDTDGVKTTDGDDVIHVYYAKAGEVYMSDLGPVVAVQWEDYAVAGTQVAMKQFENIIPVDFVTVNTKEQADFVLIANATAPVLLGRMSPPGESYEGQGEFNTAGVGWDEEGLQQGGYGYVTFIHELGHGMGLAHPHDTGGGSAVMNGVEEDSDPGDFGLNQGVFTTMSYRSGHPDGPAGDPPGNGFGYEGTLMAFDVAVLQQKYGANTSFNRGNNTYTLPSANESGTFYRGIWDTGGVDTIRTGGPASAVIDLRAATLKYEEGGGGWVSQAEGIHGGFTIVGGVTIENATSGAGNDRLTGNAVANVLSSGAGNDVLLGGGGNDVLRPGTGINQADGGAGLDTLSFNLSTTGVWADLAQGSYSDADTFTAFTSIENLTGGSGTDNLYGDGKANVLRGGAGADVLDGRAGNDVLYGGAAEDWLVGGAGNDRLFGGAGSDRLSGGSGVNQLNGGDGFDFANYGAATTGLWVDLGFGAYESASARDAFTSIEGLIGGSGADQLFGGAGGDALVGGGGDDILNGRAGADALFGEDGRDWLVGAAGDDFLIGGGGDDRLVGGAGVDTLNGGAGADIFDLGAAAGWDIAVDFDRTVDRISLAGLDFDFISVASDFNGDGVKDTQLTYEGGTFVVLGVTGLTLDDWNGLLV